MNEEDGSRRNRQQSSDQLRLLIKTSNGSAGQTFRTFLVYIINIAYSVHIINDLRKKITYMV